MARVAWVHTDGRRGRYVTFRLTRARAGGETVGKTRGKSNDLNPEYNEEFEFTFDDLRDLQAAELRFEVRALPSYPPASLPFPAGRRDANYVPPTPKCSGLGQGLFDGRRPDVYV
jgi:hypothetical protein